MAYTLSDVALKFDVNFNGTGHTNLKVFNIKHVFKDNDSLMFFPTVSLHPV